MQIIRRRPVETAIVICLTVTLTGLWTGYFVYKLKSKPNTPKPPQQVEQVYEPTQQPEQPTQSTGVSSATESEQGTQSVDEPGGDSTGVVPETSESTNTGRDNQQNGGEQPRSNEGVRDVKPNTPSRYSSGTRFRSYGNGLVDSNILGVVPEGQTVYSGGVPYKVLSQGSCLNYRGSVYYLPINRNGAKLLPELMGYDKQGNPIVREENYSPWIQNGFMANCGLESLDNSKPIPGAW